MEVGGVMILRHITSIERAKNIVETGNFICAYGDPLARDACLNCLNGSNGNQPEASGVMLKFRWSGNEPIMNKTGDLPRPLKPDYLYDEGPWRLVVPIGTTNHLTFDSIETKDREALNDFLNNCTPRYQKILCNWRTSKRQKLLAWFNSKKGVSIKVVGPNEEIGRNRVRLEFFLRVTSVCRG